MPSGGSVLLRRWKVRAFGRTSGASAIGATYLLPAQMMRCAMRGADQETLPDATAKFDICPFQISHHLDNAAADCVDFICRQLANFVPGFIRRRPLANVVHSSVEGRVHGTVPVTHVFKEQTTRICRATRHSVQAVCKGEAMSNDAQFGNGGRHRVLACPMSAMAVVNDAAHARQSRKHYEGRRVQMSYVLLIWMGMVTPPAVVPGYRDLTSCEAAGGQAAAKFNFSFLCIPGPDTANLPGGRQ